MTQQVEDPRHDPAAALALVREAHAAGPRAWSRDELVDWLSQPAPNLGRPRVEPNPPGTRGRKPTKDQYRRHAERVRELRRRFLVLPQRMRSASNPAASWLAVPDYVNVLIAVSGDPRVTPRKKAAEIARRYAREVDAMAWKRRIEVGGLTVPDLSTIRRHLKARK